MMSYLFVTTQKYERKKVNFSFLYSSYTKDKEKEKIKSFSTIFHYSCYSFYKGGD